jgi:hypothetical protein
MRRMPSSDLMEKSLEHDFAPTDALSAQPAS